MVTLVKRYIWIWCMWVLYGFRYLEKKSCFGLQIKGLVLLVMHIMIFKAVSHTTKELKNKAVLYLNLCCKHCYAVFSNMCEILIILSKVPWLYIKVYLCLVMFNISLHYNMCHWIWESLGFMHTTAKHTFHYHTIATLASTSGRHQCWKLPRLLLLYLVSESSQTSMSARVIFEWLQLPWTSSQLAINHHATGWWGWSWI